MSGLLDYDSRLEQSIVEVVKLCQHLAAQAEERFARMPTHTWTLRVVAELTIGDEETTQLEVARVNVGAERDDWRRTIDLLRGRTK